MSRHADGAPGPGPGKYDRNKSTAERRDERHRRVIQAAAKVFASTGYANATLGDVVKQAGISRQTFYEHFESMHDCLIEVYQFGIATVFSDVSSQLRGIDDPVERLELGIAGYLNIVGQNAPLALVLNREILGVGREYASRREASYSRYAALMMEGVDEAHRRGLLTRAADELTCFALVGAMETVALRYIDRGEEEKIMEAAKPLVNLVLNAFGYVGPKTA